MVLRIVYSIIRSYFYCFLSIGCCDCQCACCICYVVVTLYCFSCWCNRVCSYILTSFSADVISDLISIQCSCCISFEYRISCSECLAVTSCCYCYRLRCDRYCSFQFYRIWSIVRIRYSHFDRCIRYICVLGQICGPGLSTVVAVFYNISIKYVIDCDRMLLRIVYSIIGCYAQLAVCRSASCCDCQGSRVVGYCVIALRCFSTGCDLIVSYILTSFSCHCTLDLLIIRFFFSFHS